jgi:hypothetical protein
MKEIFKDVKDFEGLYQVSNFGRVKSWIGRTNCDIAHGRILKTHLNRKTKYLTVILYKNYRQKCFSIHRLVAINFIDNPSNLKTVNHKDFNRCNNGVENLEWLSMRDNLLHGIREKGNDRGEKNPHHKLTEKQVLKIRIINSDNPNITYKKISNIFNISSDSISLICRNKTWQHVYPKHLKT